MYTDLRCGQYVLVKNGPCLNKAKWFAWEGCRNMHLKEQHYCEFHFGQWVADTAAGERTRCDCGEVILMRDKLEVLLVACLQLSLIPRSYAPTFVKS